MNIKFKTLCIDLLPTTQEAGMMNTTDGEMSFTFTKNTWIGDLGTSCHITNDVSGLYDITNINKSCQGTSGMPATKKAAIHESETRR